jgi:hypothetical protein
LEVADVEVVGRVKTRKALSTAPVIPL